MIETIVIYEPNTRAKIGFFKTYQILFKNFVRSKDLVWQLFKRDFFAGYRKSFLGYTWLLIAPIMGVMSWIMMNSAGILTPGHTGVPYPAYILMGTAMWGLFVGSYGAAAGTLTTGSGLILQVNYPHEIMLFKQLLQQLASFTINLVIILATVSAFGVIPSWKIIFLPIIIFPTILLGTAIGLITSMLSVIAVDIGNAVQLIFGFMIYLVPVLYSKNVTNPLLALVIQWNPLTYLVCSARDLILFGTLYDNRGFLISSALGVIAFILSLRTFYLLEHKLVERMI